MAVVVAAAVAGAVVLRDDPSAVDRSIGELRDGKRFASSPRAGETLARISERLLDDGRACRGARTRCEAVLAAAGWSSVAAVATLRCTQPGTQEIRRSLLAHLETLRRYHPAEGTQPPPLPTIPTCR